LSASETSHTPPRNSLFLDRAPPLHQRRRTVLARRLADWLVPPACVVCQTPLDTTQALCAPCWRQIAFICQPLCDRTGVPLPYDPGGLAVSAGALSDPPDYDRARAVAVYDGLMRRLILSFKYHDRLEPRQLFGRLMAGAGRDLLSSADVIVPVPMHPRRLVARRFNQSAILAKELSRLTRLPVRYGLLKRPKLKRRQVELSGEQRRRNPRGAFKVPTAARRRLDGQHVLLVDDVITTGATVNACARALKSAGAAGVDVLVIGLVTADPDARDTLPVA